jgi:signal transduction histidine kinase
MHRAGKETASHAATYQKGAISFGPVTIPVNLYSAIERRETLSFNLLHAGPIQGNGNALQRVLTNLLLNAGDASHAVPRSLSGRPPSRTAPAGSA